MSKDLKIFSLREEKARLLPTETGEPGEKLAWREKSRAKVWNMLHKVPSGGNKKAVGFLSLGSQSKVLG